MVQQRYQVIERIDAGGMAEVFKATSSSMQGFEKLVAIKRVLPNLTDDQRFIRMFLDEAKVCLFLNHTNIVHVFDLGLANGAYFIVMEYVEGVNLRSLIQTYEELGQMIPIQMAAHVVIEVCKGLSHAHNMNDATGGSLGIVHRDISPPNVLISLDGEVKIVDFGLAKAKGQRETTDPGVVKGKFGYLSPEAAYGDDVDHRTDIFAAGIILWEMLTTERRFLGKTDLDTLMAVRENEWKSPSQYRNDIPEQLDRICRRALSSELTHRYENARAFAEDLAEFLYAYGKPFTSFDLADAVDSAATVSPDSQRPTSQDMAVADAMQEAVNNILHLEDIDNLDLYLAQTFGDVDEGVTSDEGWLEDPRSWADFGGIDSVIDPGTHSDDIEWQERNLEELMMTSSPDSDSTEEVWVDLSDADLAQMKPSQPDASAQLLSAEIERQRHQTEQMKALDKDILAEEQERTQLLSRVKTEQDSGWANVGYLEKKPETQSVASPPSKPGVPGIVWVLVGMLVLAIIAVFALQSQGFIAP